jgi:hypothetical protein|tara:strand:+ start:1798 stop:2031 length:234 start_codon:yes stop_codon:yes gene_type:complete
VNRVPKSKGSITIQLSIDEIKNIIFSLQSIATHNIESKEIYNDKYASLVNDLSIGLADYYKREKAIHEWDNELKSEG